MKTNNARPSPDAQQGAAAPLPLRPVRPIPKISVETYLDPKSPLVVPDAYVDSLVRELIRRNVTGGADLRFQSETFIQDFTRYVTTSALLMYELSLAKYLTAHPLGLYLAESKDVDLTSEFVMRYEDAAKAYPSVGKLYHHLLQMFPVIRIAGGTEIMPFLPSRVRIKELFDGVAKGYEDSVDSMVIIANMLTPVPASSILVTGYPVLCGLTQNAKRYFDIQETNQLTQLGWPYMWSKVNMKHSILSKLDVEVHYIGCQFEEDHARFNLTMQGKADVGVIVAGRNRVTVAQRDNSTTLSLGSSPVTVDDVPNKPAITRKPIVDSRRKDGGKDE